MPSFYLGLVRLLCRNLCGHEEEKLVDREEAETRGLFVELLHRGDSMADTVSREFRGLSGLEISEVGLCYEPPKRDR